MTNAQARRAARQSWEKFLDADSLRFNLSVGSVYLTAYELLLDALVDRPKEFFAIGWSKEKGVLLDSAYARQILSRHRMPYFASADWFVEMGALDLVDVETLKRIREHRNFVAHNIPRIVMVDGVDVDLDLLGAIVKLVAKLDRWWLQYVEIPCNPDFDSVEVPQKEIDEAISLRLYNLHLLVSFVSGDDQPLRDLHRTFSDVWPLAES